MRVFSAFAKHEGQFETSFLNVGVIPDVVEVINGLPDSEQYLTKFLIGVTVLLTSKSKQTLPPQKKKPLNISHKSHTTKTFYWEGV